MRAWMSWAALVLLVGVGLALPPVAAQTDPCAGQPQTGACALGRADTSGITLAGTFTYDWSDGAGNDLSYGGGALGVSEDGQFLYVTCNNANPRRGIAKLALPATLGTIAPIAAPCLGPDETEIKTILAQPWDAGQALIGGVLEQDGRLVVAAYGSYDANDTAIASHWMSTSFATMNANGPYKGTLSTGLVKGHMGPIPQEWRALLGGPAFSMAGYTSIVSRQSDGATFSVFDPATITANNFLMTMLIGCPHAVPGCATWTNWGPSSDGFEGTELSAGGFIIPGTRTFVAVEREASGTIPPGGTVPMEGYGYATTTLSLHGQPYPSPEGVRYIYSLSDPVFQKGNKGYPYRLVAKLYDLYEAWQVKQGQKTFNQVKQYATINLPGSSASEIVQSGAYNPVRKEFYLIRGTGAGINTVYVFRNWGENTSGGGGGPTPPIAVADTYTMQADTTLTVTAPGVLTNDLNTPTSATLVSPPASGSFSFQTDGSFVYTPPGAFTGVQTFTYNAVNAGGSSQGTGTITVQAGPPPPPSTVLTILSATTTCRVVLGASPPTSEGWGVQFTYTRPGGNPLPFGSRDASAPYTRTLSLSTGQYTLAGTWTKTGATPVSIVGQAFVCPEP